MTSGAAPVPFFKRCLTAPKTAVALLSALLFVAALHFGFGTEVGSSLSTTLGAGDQAVVRHSALLRDGLRPVVAAEHGDRTSAPPPRLPAALVLAAVVVAAPVCGRVLRAVAGTISCHSHFPGHRPRAPPIAT
ncbi:hypothetical protein [Pleomorphomonas sp. NRK KF1]|uniref:hypothetical protein n=1 Tax=Pleomorphomonas sp. NRK KF1 TaxID=2943000 RepID=UPI002044953C|nr:hypothetical protein [Pleomorphomonas sp. NRK KF1]MCM5554531.1 hypothetical protein [Pleomorphomonas sp. NRK KF1]